ncbi:hypothetical protein M9458_037733, partial [Cirrhinus mrigala]
AFPHISGQSLRGNAYCTVQHDFPPLHHRGHVGRSFGATHMELGGVAHTSQSVPLAHSNNSTCL